MLPSDFLEETAAQTAWRGVAERVDGRVRRTGRAPLVAVVVCAMLFQRGWLREGDRFRFCDGSDDCGLRDIVLE
jgi:hypothetical protein